MPLHLYMFLIGFCFVCSFFNACVSCPILVCFNSILLLCTFFWFFSNERKKGVDLGGWVGSGRSWRGEVRSEYIVFKKIYF